MGNDPADRSEFLQNPQMILRAHGAVRADDLDAAFVQKRPGVLRTRAAEGAAFFRVSHFRNDGELRERTNRFDGRHEFGGIPKCFQDEKIHAAFLERLGLLAKNFPEMFRRGFARITDHAERPDRSRNQNFVAGGLARLARDFHAAMIEFRDALFQAECAQLVPIGAERVGLDDVRAGFEIGHVHAKHFFGARGVQFVDAALRPESFVEQGAHGSVRDQHGVTQSLLKFFDSHGLEHSPGSSAKMNSSVYRFAGPVGMQPRGLRS